jgi:hypothetical protein
MSGKDIEPDKCHTCGNAVGKTGYAVNCYNMMAEDFEICDSCMSRALVLPKSRTGKTDVCQVCHASVEQLWTVFREGKNLKLCIPCLKEPHGELVRDSPKIEQKPADPLKMKAVRGGKLRKRK